MNHQYRDLRIEEVLRECPDVVSIRLRSADGTPLPPWEPGAHVDVRLPSGLVRQYSLCGDPHDPLTYTIAVLREPGGRGGSVEMHTLAVTAATLSVRGPRNNFALRPAPEYLFLAGGIGITPIASMVRHVAERGGRWALHYGGRTRESMAFVDRLARFGADRVSVWPQDESGLLPLADIIEGASPQAHVYACGPGPMLDAVARVCAGLAVPRTLRVERFGAPEELSPAAPSGGPDGAFEVELAESGVRLAVPADRTVLDVVREAVPDVEFSCQEGYCGTCETQVLSGEPDHRDTYLTEEERAGNEVMMICVSRSRGPLLRLLL